ncbi:MAG TPA: tRNA pseudouridine(38-40) synthase TruA [Candidatus Polarisedimenticolaceae bacterium]|nr:tRNA pseudouridine(38-40) synthase TruA [Candidatus Polarisedimenticolaceae bacterium]
MPTYRLDLEYEGTRYRGWQEQQNARSVAGELRSAIGEAGGAVVELGGAGRTDAGVHAAHQVAHLRLRERIDPKKFRLAVNDALPHDIHVLALSSASDRFHARHDAVLRSYVYQISRRRTALAKRSVWWIKRSIDPALMAEAVAAVPGMHDFAAFCERPQDQTSTRVLVDGAEVVEDGALILVRLVASHFLWKMVRRVVGALVKVGAEDLPVPEFKALLKNPSRTGTAEWTAPPSGLFLERVLYAGDPPLPALRALVPVSGEASSSKGSGASRPASGAHRTR